MRAFVLPLEDIDETEKSWSFSVDSSWLLGALADTDLRPGAAREGDAPASVDDASLLEVTAQRTGEDILVRGRLRTCVVTDCGRCLEDARIPVDVELTTLFLPETMRQTARHGDAHVGADTRPGTEGKSAKLAKAAKEELHDDNDDDVEDGAHDYYAGDEIVLDDIVRELIVLEEPMQPLCRPDCPGIPIPEGVRPPADFGRAEGVVDPRLSPLLKLKRAMAQTEE